MSQKPNPEPRTAAIAGCVIIGRNEGERLVACLSSLAHEGIPTVYVDSGSTDASVSSALQFGAEIVELPMDRPFTAARARNAGFRRLTAKFPDVVYVQFVDGDCKIAPHWIDAAIETLATRPSVAITFGQRREIRPDASLYNAICGIEWATPPGESPECGGDFLIRSPVFSAMNGFYEPLIAGEEPELCYRIRKAGWSIIKLDLDMTYHDANITQFSQWSRRQTRAGYAYASRALLHARDRKGYCMRENLRIVIWAFGIPLVVIVGFLLNVYSAAWLLLLYPIQLIRVFLKERSTARPAKLALAYSSLLLVGRFFEFFGQMQFAYRRLTGSVETLIEYK